MNYFRSLDRRERLIGGAALNILFAVSLFFDWFANDQRGWDIDSSWIALIVALVAALLLLAEAFDYELPRFPVTGVAAYLTSLTFFYVIIVIVQVRDQEWGIIVALILSILSTMLTLLAWLADRDRQTA